MTLPWDYAGLEFVSEKIPSFTFVFNVSFSSYAQLGSWNTVGLSNTVEKNVENYRNYSLKEYVCIWKLVGKRWQKSET